MKTVQSQIGLLFFTFSFCLCLSKVAYCLLGFQPWDSLLTFDRVSKYTYCFIFLLTIFWNSNVSKCLQIIAILFEAIYSLRLTPEAPFFGLSMIIIALLLSYKYGLLKKHFISKAIITFSILYLLFVFIPLANRSDRLVYAGEWILFLAFFLGTVWFIFRDSIKSLEEKESETKERYMKIIDEATSVAREAIDLCEKEKQKIDER